jgi:streptogramin lyase
MHRTRRRVLAVLALAAAVAAGVVAVRSALEAPASDVKATRTTLTSRSVSFGPASVAVEVLPSGAVCYTVSEPAGRAHGCRAKVGVNEIGYAVSPRGIGGVAGPSVSAVIVKFTRRGTRWATLEDGVFYADVPVAYRVRAILKVLRDGTRKRFSVTPSS